MQKINMNDEFLKMFIHSNDELKKISLFVVATQHFRNKNASFVFQIKSLN